MKKRMFLLLALTLLPLACLLLFTNSCATAHKTDTTTTTSIASTTTVSGTTTTTCAQTSYTLVASWGAYGTGDGQFRAPKSITIDSGNKLYVLDDSNYRVTKFDTSGTYLLKWGSSGTTEGKFNYPISGVAVNASGEVFVTDGYNYRVQYFDGASGSYLGQWGSQGAGDGQVKTPMGVAVGPGGYIYVADTGNSRVQKFSPLGVFVSKFTTTDPTLGNIGPHDIVVDSTGNIYVTQGYGSIIKYTNSGTYVTSFSGLTAGNSQGIGIDSLDNIYATNSYMYYRVDKFDVNGNLLCEIGTKAASPIYGDFDGFLYDVTVDSSGNVYVIDNGSSTPTIKKFAP
ncbi:MAG: 6-bladed beta-propeller [Candidatus Saganbacteria bacterium]|nr:6-bladed beta-propeller [Candidatus Saganbacteria bacterium]